MTKDPSNLAPTAMPFHLFQYALPGPSQLEDLNAFLAQNRIVAVHHHMVMAASGSQLVFLLQTADRAREPQRKLDSKEGRIDYRAVLSPQEFIVYSKLRDERRAIAEAEGVPVYTVFSNAQLAEMVQRKVRTQQDLLAIEGVGQARVDRYAARILPHLVEATA